MARNVENTIAEMKELAKTHQSVLVGFSGGKDSLAVLDLCCRFFKRVTPFQMYLVPGMAVDDDVLKPAKELFGLEVQRFPHFEALEALKNGVYCEFWPDLENLPTIERWPYYKWLLKETGCSLLVDGSKKADGSFRRRNFANETEEQRRMRYHPLKHWLKWEVLSYLQARNIPIPKQAGDTAAGNGSTASMRVDGLLWLHDNHPLDFKLVEEVYMHVGAVVARRQFFGLSDG